MQVTRATFIPLLAPGSSNRIDPGAVREKYCADLSVVYTFGPQFGRRIVTHADLDQLELSPRMLRRAALEHLEVLAGRAEFHGQPPALMLSFEGLESSLLLATDFWSRLQGAVPGELVVGVPARDVVIVTGSQSVPGLEKVRRCVDRVFMAGDEFPLTRGLLVRRGGAWEPFDGPQRQSRLHPAARHHLGGPNQPPRQFQEHLSWPEERVAPVPGRRPMGPGHRPGAEPGIGRPRPGAPLSPAATGSMPAAAMSATGSMPRMPNGAMRPGAVGPNGAMPPGAVGPNGAMPPGAVPLGAMPGGPMPAGPMPGGGMPHTGPVAPAQLPAAGPVSPAQLPPTRPTSPAGPAVPRPAEGAPNLTGAMPVVPMSPAPGSSTRSAPVSPAADYRPVDVAPYSAVPYSAVPYSAVPYSAVPHGGPGAGPSAAPAGRGRREPMAQPASGMPTSYEPAKPAYRDDRYPTGLHARPVYPEYEQAAAPVSAVPQGYLPHQPMSAVPSPRFRPEQPAYRPVPSYRAEPLDQAEPPYHSEPLFRSESAPQTDTYRDSPAPDRSRPEYPGTWGSAPEAGSSRPEFRSGPRARFTTR
ncbi:MAG TPA: hypothetical protein VF163_02680 [Micromonosporaceae bacterium]